MVVIVDVVIVNEYEVNDWLLLLIYFVIILGVCGVWYVGVDGVFEVFVLMVMLVDIVGVGDVFVGVFVVNWLCNLGLLVE